MHDLFHKFSSHTSAAVGSAYAFIIAMLIIVIWIVSGPIFQFSDTWQLVINTGTTIVTFLMVFLIQNTQNRDSRAIHLKLDELIYSNKRAQDKYIDAEDLSDGDLSALKQKLHKEMEKREQERKKKAN